MEIRGIDISEWQGNISKASWISAKESGIEFAMIRCGYTTYGKSKQKKIDYYFENNYRVCKEIGMPIGVYYYSCATTVDEAIEEANFVLDIIKNKQFEYPIVIDTEDNHDITNSANANTSQASIGKNRLTPIIKAFCETIANAGYYASIYASTYWFENNLILDDLVAYDKWIAQWANSVSVGYKYGLWQYSSTGTVPGIGNDIDLDYAYIDYPEVMITNGLNGYTKVDIPSEPDKPTLPVTPIEPNIPDKPVESDDEIIRDCNIIFNFVKMVSRIVNKFTVWLKSLFRK